MAASTTSHYQSFRDPSTFRTVLIRTHPNKDTDERFVLWKDIQAIFPHTNYILHDNKAVQFMLDDNFEELAPLRISYHPGVILDIVSASEHADKEPPQSLSEVPRNSESESSAIALRVTKGPTHGYCKGRKDNILAMEDPACSRLRYKDETITTLTSSSTNAAADLPSSQGCIIDNVTSALQQLSVSIATAGAISGSTVSVEEAQRSLQQFNQVESMSGVQPTITIQKPRISATIETDAGQHVVVKIDVSANDLFQSHSTQMLQTVILENQRLLRASIRQHFEMSEYTIPRLFVVLPKPKRKRDKLLGPLKKQQFKLFFLCECGSYTQNGNHRFSGRIHLASHEGYDLDRVNDFFVKYGSYVLNILKMIKITLAVTGIAVPALASFKLVEGIESIEKSIGSISRNAGSLLDHAIKSVESKTKNRHDLAT
ncbi:hypothetical protein BGX31_001952, partial [Mortierella sp. GBA43]